MSVPWCYILGFLLWWKFGVWVVDSETWGIQTWGLGSEALPFKPGTKELWFEVYCLGHGKAAWSLRCKQDIWDAPFIVGMEGRQKILYLSKGMGSIPELAVSNKPVNSRISLIFVSLLLWSFGVYFNIQIVMCSLILWKVGWLARPSCLLISVIRLVLPFQASQYIHTTIYTLETFLMFSHGERQVYWRLNLVNCW